MIFETKLCPFCATLASRPVNLYLRMVCQCGASLASDRAGRAPIEDVTPLDALLWSSRMREPHTEDTSPSD